MQKKWFFISITFLCLAGGGLLKWHQSVQKKKCMDNVLMLERAKMKFGAVYGAALGDEISIKSLETYMRGGITNLKCPSGGQYKLNKVGEHVTCSIHVDEKNKE